MKDVYFIRKVRNKPFWRVNEVRDAGVLIGDILFSSKEDASKAASEANTVEHICNMVDAFEGIVEVDGFTKYAGLFTTNIAESYFDNEDPRMSSAFYKIKE